MSTSPQTATSTKRPASPTSVEEGSVAKKAREEVAEQTTQQETNGNKTVEEDSTAEEAKVSIEGSQGESNGKGEESTTSTIEDKKVEGEKKKMDDVNMET